MNYLGHAIFSPADEFITLGNLSGDFLKNRFHAQLTPGIIDGVYLHRAIDTFTDNHLSIRAMLPYFRPKFGKYSGVVMDVLLDYLLCDLWESLFVDEFEDFCASIYSTIFQYSGHLPERPATIMSQMAASGWLAAYSQEERLYRVFLRLSDKAKVNLSGPLAMDIVRENKEDLLSHSIDFLSELKLYLKKEGLLSDNRISWKT